MASSAFASKVTPVDAPYHKLEGQELCYMCLEDCDVWFLGDDDGVSGTGVMDKDRKQQPKDEKPNSAWMNVSVPQSYHARSLPKDKMEQSDQDVACSHCHLVLMHNKNIKSDDRNAPSVCLYLNGPRFDGTIHDTKPNANHCRCKFKKPRQRSDAALVIGAALTSHDLGQFMIKSIKVAPQEIPTPGTGSSLKRAKATILITFTCLEIHRKPTVNGESEQRGVRRFLTNSSKPFPASTQLLMCLIRSDWEYYDATIARMDNVNDKNGELKEGESAMPAGRRRKPNVSFFPPKMTLENAYNRIHGVSVLSEWYFGSEGSQKSSKSNDNDHEIANTIIPSEDVWHLVGSYLTAPSLYAARCTCKRLYHALRGVVPGLTLKLYQHQIKSLLWMRWRETKLLHEYDLASIQLQSKLQRRINSREADVHRAATGGASVILCPRNATQGVRISQVNGDEIEVPQDSVMSRPLAQGGLLCDDPGLGKTITVISLILQTLGLSTEKLESQDIPATPKEDEDVEEKIFKAYWKENIVQEFRRQEITQLFNSFLKCNADIGLFLRKADLQEDGVVFRNIICLKDIKERISKDVYGDCFETFETDVRLCFTNVMLHTAQDSLIHRAAGRLSIIFGAMVDEFKQKQVKTARKSFSSPARRPNSGVAAFVEKTNAKRLNDALLPSCGTLLVVPAVLLDHWVDQLKSHVNTAFCTDKTPIICDYNGSNDSALKMEEILTQCKVEKTHFPLLFIDRTSSKKLPSASFLAMFRVVLTTNQRFSNEWSNGSFESELKKKDEKEKNGASVEDSADRYRNEREEASPLLKVNWLRMIVDEGHSMGRSKDSSHILFASWVNSERRWAMTGTPTKQTSSQTGLSNVSNLLEYLNHDFFSRRQGGDAVWNMITRGWNRGLLSSFFRMRSLFSLIMIRHTKDDIEELSPPIYKTRIMPMSQEEVSTYNTLCCAVQTNLLVTSMKGKTSGLQDSLLHKSQSKHAIKALDNLRTVCVGGTQVRLTLTEKNWRETLALFDASNDDGKKRQEKVRLFLSRATTVCTECVDNKTTSCIVCDKKFDVDEFQKLQPGFDFRWQHNIEEELRLRRQGNTNGGNDAPGNNGAGNNGNVGNNPVNNIGGGNAPNNNPNVNMAPFQGRVRVNRPGDGHECEYSQETPGICHLCFRQHEECDLMNEAKRCDVCHLCAEDCPTKETKPSYVVDKILNLYQEQEASKVLSMKLNVPFGFRMEERRPLKVIVFSQFRKTLNQTGDRLLRRFGSGCIAEYWGSYRKKELQKFVHDEKCVCMLLGKDGSEGLDLSFVTHIIFLEQVWDKSLESQAVSRAWRMGAKGAVVVETLIAQDSIEENMAKLEKQLENEFETEGDDVEGVRSVADGVKASEYKRAKTHYLLKHLKLITNSNTLGFASGQKRKASELNTEAHAEASASRTKNRGANFNVRFEAQQETYEYGVN